MKFFDIKTQRTPETYDIEINARRPFYFAVGVGLAVFAWYLAGREKK